MSIERSASIFVGIPIDKVNFNKTPLDDCESLVEDLFITTDSWCGGDEFYGKELLHSVEEGIAYPLNQNAFNKLQSKFEITKQELIKVFNQLGLEFNADDIQPYFAVRCL